MIETAVFCFSLHIFAIRVISSVYFDVSSSWRTFAPLVCLLIPLSCPSEDFHRDTLYKAAAVLMYALKRTFEIPRICWHLEFLLI